MDFRLALLTFFFLSACTSGESFYHSGDEIESAGPIQGFNQQLVKQSGVHSVGSESIEWTSCREESSKSWFVLLNPGDIPFSKKEECHKGILGLVAAQGFNSLAINRFGYGQSVGVDNFGDDKSVSVTFDAINHLIPDDHEVIGLWAYGDAAFLGFRLSKSLSLKLLIVGDAVYDWERVKKESSDQLWLSKIGEVENLEGAIFSEKRSVAWDFSFLPKTTYLYHSVNNSRVPLLHATDFRNALSTAGHNTELIVIQPSASSPEVPHEGVLKNLLSNYKSQKNQK